MSAGSIICRNQCHPLLCMCVGVWVHGVLVCCFYVIVKCVHIVCSAERLVKVVTGCTIIFLKLTSTHGFDAVFVITLLLS